MSVDQYQHMYLFISGIICELYHVNCVLSCNNSSEINLDSLISFSITTITALDYVCKVLEAFYLSINNCNCCQAENCTSTIKMMHNVHYCL